MPTSQPQDESNNQALIGFLTHSIFGGNSSIASLISDYQEEPDISCLIKDIIENNLNDSSKELLTFFQRIISNFPKMANLNLTNPIQFRKACLFIEDNSADISIKEIGLFNNWTIQGIVGISLAMLGGMHPMNTVDPITLMEIDEDDLFTTMNGQCFSLTTLINYHNYRDYRGTRGEHYGSKFLLNPLTNEPFFSRDAEILMSRAIRKNLPPIIHLSTTNMPAEYTNTMLSRLCSPAKVYGNFCAIAAAKQQPSSCPESN